MHCCGFDSIPSDLGVLMLQKASMERHGKPLSEIKLLVGKTKGGLSGGTLASMLNMVENFSDSKVRKSLGNPYALNPKDGVRGPDGSDQRRL